MHARWLLALYTCLNVVCDDSEDCAGDVAWWCAYIQPTDCYEASGTCCRTCQEYRKPVPGKTAVELK